MCMYKRQYTIPETKDETSHGTTKIYQLIGAGILDARKAGTRTLITGESLRVYVESLPKANIRTGQRVAGARNVAFR